MKTATILVLCLLRACALPEPQTKYCLLEARLAAGDSMTAELHRGGQLPSSTTFGVTRITLPVGAVARVVLKQHSIMFYWTIRVPDVASFELANIGQYQVQP